MSRADLFGAGSRVSPAISLSERQRLDWLRLIRSESIGPRTFRSLINRHGGAAAALEALPALLKKAGKAELRMCTQAEAEAELAGLTRLGARLVALGEKDYPAALAAIDSAPPLLTILGRADIAARPCIAIVGSRNASAAGSRMAEKLAQMLGLAGITDRIVPYLVLLSAVVPPIAGVYLPRFFLDQHPGDAPLADADWQPGAIAALLLGIAAAAVGQFHGGWLTGLVAIDSLLVSSLSYLAFEWIRRAVARRATARP